MSNTPPVTDARFGPDASWVAIAGKTGVQLFHTDDGRPRRTLPTASPVRDLAVSTDGRRIVAGTSDSGVIVWDSDTGEVESRMQPAPRALAHLELSPDGRRYAVSLDERDIVLVHDVETGRAAMQTLTNPAPVVSTRFSPDGKRLAVATTSGSIVLWDLPNSSTADEGPVLPQAVRRREAGRHEGVVWSSQFNSDGKRLVTASSDRTARIWEVESGKVLREFRHQKPVYTAGFGPGARQVITGSADHAARIWDARNGRLVGEPMWHPGAVWYAEFSEDGKLALTGDDTGHARLWDAASGLPLSGWVKHGVSLKRVRLSRDNRLALCATVDQGVRVWRPLLAPGPAPAWLPELAEAVAGTQLGQHGNVQPVPFERLAELRVRLTSETSTDFYSRWARWFLVERMQSDPPSFP